MMKEVHRSGMLLECEAFGVSEGFKAFVLATTAQTVFDEIVSGYVAECGIPKRSAA